MNFARLSILLFTATLAACQRDDNHQRQMSADNNSDSALFTLMNPGLTGLNFNNQLTEAPNTNILMYEYFYNGAGVATADFNADGLIDVYFTSNMGENKLFLNKGNLKFEDVTDASGAKGRVGPWKTGVSVADINGDHLPDIFVCYSGMVKEENRVNQLFINQGNNSHGIPTFIERSKEYGLTNPSFTNQAYFFDYDRDQDLDLLLLNHNPVNLPILNESSTATLLKKDDRQKGIRLFRQENDKFIDVTASAGINGSALTYGLGAGISDINNDGWPDIYISNDYSVPDYLYINNQNSTFTNRVQQSLGHTSQFSMGNDIADVSNDGLLDIFTLDMLPEDNHRQKLLMAPDNYAKFDLNVRLGFYHQYMRNMLHVNNGNGTFSEIGQLAGVSNTDWSWAPLLADFDNDGWKDLFVTNGYVRDYTNLDFIKYMDDYVKQKGRLMREEVLGIIEHMPASNVSNYIFSNEKGLRFSKKTSAWGIDRPSNSNGAAYADFDNDGDLDLIVNNINQNAFLYRNNAEQTGKRSLTIELQGEGRNTFGVGTKISLWHDGKCQVLEQMPARGYLSTVSPRLHFGLDKLQEIDSLIVCWPSGKSQVVYSIAASSVKLKESEAKRTRPIKSEQLPLFTKAPTPMQLNLSSSTINDFKRQPLLLTQQSHLNRKLVKGDVNNDGLEDIFVNGGNGASRQLFVQDHKGNFVKKEIKDLQLHPEQMDAEAVFVDINNDGYQDLYVASGGYHNLSDEDQRLQDRLYINDKTGNFAEQPSWLPPLPSSKGAVVAADFNADGKQDLFVGGRIVPGKYPETPRSYLLINTGNKLIDKTQELAPQLNRIGMVSDAIAFDVNQDGSKDLIVVGEWMPITILINEGGKLVDRTLKFFDRKYSGWWNSIDTADFNNDGITDLIAGNLGFNSQCKASVQMPAEIFFKDFDNNGSVDPLFTFYIKGKQYPYITRDELLEQIGAMRYRFTDYESYSDATISDIIPKQELQQAGHLIATDFQTSVFLGSAIGPFSSAQLPVQAQYSPVHASSVFDYNEDGNLDLLLCGNNAKSKIKLGKYDANYGVLLEGDGKGGFTYIPQHESGFMLTGDVRSIIALKDKLLFGVNDLPLVMYRRASSRPQSKMLANTLQRNSK